MKDNLNISGDSKIIITGGLGFIGSNLVESLTETGAEIHIIDSELQEYGANLFNIKNIKSKVYTHGIDVRNSESIDSLFSKVKPDTVFHLAAQLSRPKSIKDPSLDIDINCQGTVNVLDSIKDHCPNASVVFTSSQAVYGVPESLPLTEQSETKPIDIYGANKLAAEKYCFVYQQVHDIDINVVRLTNVYGPRAQLDNPNYGVINKFIRKALEDEELTVYEPGTMLRDFIYIEDVVDALLTVNAQARSGKLFLIGTGDSTSIGELAETIVKVAGSGTVTMTEWPDDWEGIRIGDISVNTEKIISETEWEPQTDIQSGIKTTISYYQQYLEKYV